MKNNRNTFRYKYKSRSSVLIYISVLIIASMFVFLRSTPIFSADTVPSENDSMRFNEGQKAEMKIPSRTPDYVSTVLKNPSKPLVASDRGYLEIDVMLNKIGESYSKNVMWNRSSATPLTIWISTPPESGIRFIDRDRPDRPYHHLLVKCAAPDDSGDQIIKKKIEYTVASDTKTGKHSFWLDISADLVDREGNKINDTGVETLAFEVDTHLKTKILMIAVIGIVVLLFIMEWIRVDVVAILMMVLLPELGLLNAQDAFRGLSSNAVIAIIGVMIISYGLNRTGLVNRVLQPLMKFVVKSPGRLVVIFSSLIACISSVMQNTGAAVLFLPAIRITSARSSVCVFFERI